MIELCETLNENGPHPEVSTILRDLIDEIGLVPVDGELRTHPKGSLTEMLAFVLNRKFHDHLLEMPAHRHVAGCTED